MTLEDEVALEDAAIFALFTAHGVSTEGGDICHAIAEKIVRERRASFGPAQPAPASMLDRIENECGLEPSFQSLDDGGDAAFAEKDPDKRFAVYDAEMVVVCRCKEKAVADLICDLLNAAAR